MNITKEFTRQQLPAKEKPDCELPELEADGDGEKEPELLSFKQMFFEPNRRKG
jgi:hypothetical protein